MEQQEEIQTMGHVFKALEAIKLEINATGVAKQKTNTQNNFKYRGVDDALDLFSGPLARNAVMATPSFKTVSRGILETSGGKSMAHVVVECYVTFLSLRDGSVFVTGTIEGEGTDMLASATSKATSVAYRNLMFLTFTVPFGPEEQEQDETGTEIGIGDAGGEVLDGEQVGNKNEVIDVSDSQRKLLGVKLKNAGKDEQWLLGTFGGVTGSNINAAIKHIEQAPAR